MDEETTPIRHFKYPAATNLPERIWESAELYMKSIVDSEGGIGENETIKALDALNATAQDMVEQLKEINKNLGESLFYLQNVHRELEHARLAK